MKQMLAISAAVVALVAAATQNTSVTWKTLGNRKADDGKYHYTQRITVRGDLDFPRLGFNMFARRMQTLNPADTLVEVFPGYYYIASDRLKSGADSVVIDIDVANALFSRAYAPDGFHRINADGTTCGVAYTPEPLNSRDQWSVPGRDRMPYGPEVYDLNESLQTDYEPGVYDVIPSFKKVTLTGGMSTIKAMTFTDTGVDDPEYYTLTIRNDSLIVACKTDRQWAVMNHFNSKVLMPNAGLPLPNAVIENRPDFPWRGLHVDISRNFQTPQTMKTVVALLSANNMNRLHFHAFDDEAWRVEINGLPELTQLASRRGYAPQGETEYLYQIFAGDGNPDSREGSANGFWTRAEFVDFLRTAHVLGVDVIPEIESPGHARAAIKAMEKRHRDGDSSYRLIHDGDTSRYTSAQSYHDNVMNPALPGTYKFMGKVFDELIDMYREAGVPLVGIHIGGDEVPRGAWNGSAVAQDFMKQHGMTAEKQLHAYFVRRMSEMLAERNVPMFGWEEIAVGHGDDFNSAVAPTVGGVNCWHIGEKAANKAVGGGYPVIIGNVDHFYLDMMYTPHPMEQGLSWGGYVDEFSALDGYPDKLCTVSGPGKVIGIQGQIWAETIRNPQQLYAIMLPKMLGLAERAWNADSTYSHAQYNKIIGEKELPVYAGKGTVLSVHMRQPGIKILDDGLVHMNAPYRGGEIRYTTDGSVPTESSALYTGPFAPAPGATVRAVYIRNNAVSVPTFLLPDDKTSTIR